MHLRSAHLAVAVALSSLLVQAMPARAQTPPADLPLIQNKLFPMGFKIELSPLYNYSLNDKYTHHTGMQLVAGFHIFDFLAVELFGGYHLNGFGELNSIGGYPSALKSGWTSLTDAVNAYTHSADAPDFLRNKALELPDLYYQSWFAGGDVMFSPFYGKWSIVSEVGGTIAVYGVLGGGAAGTTKEDYRTPGAVITGPIVFPLHYGVGTRIYFTRWLALRVELRDYWWLNPEVQEQVSDTDTTDPCKGGYCLTVDGQKQQYLDFSRTTLLQAGVSFMF